MLKFICGIPEVIGWGLVGIVGVACAIMLWKLGKVFVEMWKDWHEEDENGD